MVDARLDEVRRRRGPAGGSGLSEDREGSGGRFVIQKHDASSLHYDVRLEADARRNPVSTEPDSVKTGRSLEEIAREEG